MTNANGPVFFVDTVRAVVPNAFEGRPMTHSFGHEPPVAFCLSVEYIFGFSLGAYTVGTPARTCAQAPRCVAVGTRWQRQERAAPLAYTAAPTAKYISAPMYAKAFHTVLEEFREPVPRAVGTFLRKIRGRYDSSSYFCRAY